MRAVSRQDKTSIIKNILIDKSCQDKIYLNMAGVQSFFSTNVLIVLQLNRIELLTAEHFEK